MYKTRIQLNTMTDIHKFVSIVSEIREPITLTDGKGYTVNAKSMLGCVAALEWDNLFVSSPVDIYMKISAFAVV